MGGVLVIAGAAMVDVCDRVNKKKRECLCSWAKLFSKRPSE